MRCAEARAQLQEEHDAVRTPGTELADHLAGCAGCSAFAEFLAALGTGARDALDAATAGMRRPNYAEIFTRAMQTREQEAVRARRFRLTFASAAAVLVAGIGIAAGVHAWVGHRERVRVAASVNGFVEELFASPLLADADVPMDEGTVGLRDWLEGAETPLLP
jgi:predicted anti-sigma-YlaC factor YlaD